MHGHVEDHSAFRLAWAAELSDVLQGLAVTRMIFDPLDLVEVGSGLPNASLIEKLLDEALQLREEAYLIAPVADTLNSLGALRLKQKQYRQAEEFHRRSLEVRRGLGEGTDEGKSKQQMIAQSLVSLGSLMISQGDELVEAERKAEADRLYDEARSWMEEAKEAYVQGFHAQHPKVAWAIEGLGNIHEKQGNLAAAINAYKEATTIRQYAQSMDTSKEMFSKELAADEAKLVNLARRRGVQSSMRQRLKVAMVFGDGGK